MLTLCLDVIMWRFPGFRIIEFFSEKFPNNVWHCMCVFPLILSRMCSAELTEN